MNAKITKDRLKTMLSYDWFKIILSAFALIIGWMLVFNITATKIMDSQKLGVCNYMSNLGLENAIYTNLDDQLRKGKLTHETLEVEAFDLAAGDTSSAEILNTYASVNMLDLIFLSQQPDTSSSYTTTDEEGNEITAYKNTYLQTFTGGYGMMLHNLSLTDEDGYFKSLERYLNRYYTNGYENGDGLDTAKIEEDFRVRAKGDKRYKKEKQIQKGIEGDIDRIQKYRNALLAFKGYLAEDRVEIVNVPLIGTDDKDIWQGKGNFAINICKKEADSAALSKYVSYSKEYLDENGKTKYAVSSLNMCVCFFDSNGEEEAHRYEALVYLTNLLDVVYA